MRKHAHGNVTPKLPLFHNRAFLIEDYANCVALGAATAEALQVIAKRDDPGDLHVATECLLLVPYLKISLNMSSEGQLL